jgi:uncharacterized protein YciI
MAQQRISPSENFMRSITAIFGLVAGLLLALALAAQDTAPEPEPAPAYDVELAQRLGADDYGMKKYVLVLLKTGPRDAEYKDQARNDIFAGHMKNIGRLADAGQLAVAGPFRKNEQALRGLFILNVETVEEARALVDTDPAVSSGVLVAELTPWYGSASLMATPEIHKTIAKQNP